MIRKSLPFFLLCGLLTALFILKINNLSERPKPAAFQNAARPVIIKITEEYAASPAALPQPHPGSPEMEQAIRRRLDADALAAAPGGSQFNALPDESLFYGRRLAGIYARMAPEDAARIIETMDSREIVRLLQMMRTEDAAAILTRIRLDKAKEVTEQMLNDTGSHNF